MAENSGKSIRKIGSIYLDWHDRETTEEAYLSQFPPSIVKGDMSNLIILEPPTAENVVVMDSDIGIVYSGRPTIRQSYIPNASALQRNGLMFVDQVPTTKEGLVEISGIGDKGAENILAYLAQE